MCIDVITIFPDMLVGFLGQSMMKRAAQAGQVHFNCINLRDFTDDKHRTTDERPFGGGPGMIMKPEPIFKAVESVRTEKSLVILMCPQGRTFNQEHAQALSTEEHLIFVCGHYEGVDERIREALIDKEISIGDYVLTHGVLPAAVVIDAVVRLIPGVLGGDGALDKESFIHDRLDHPHYTRPVEFRGMPVPDELLSGNHAAIAAWRENQSEKRTAARRPDLLAACFRATAGDST